jgi:hypothetical protein
LIPIAKKRQPIDDLIDAPVRHGGSKSRTEIAALGCLASVRERFIPPSHEQRELFACLFLPPRLAWLADALARR